MPFYSLSEQELTGIAKKHLFSLEFWLRRVIDNVLTEAYGDTYWKPSEEASSTPNILSKGVREKVQERIDKSVPGRFSRWIDATLIEHQIELVTNNKLYDDLFKPFFALLFPGNFSQEREYIKFVLGKCASVRNAVYHSNPISVRQVEQTVCYTNDIIESIKAQYATLKMQETYNAPTIIGFNDSRGLQVLDGQFNKTSFGKHVNLPEHYKMRPGDRIRFSIEVDSSFRSDEYTIEWRYGTMMILGQGASILLELEEKHVSERASISVEVISNKKWHRHRHNDDDLSIVFRVLPPLQ